MTERRQLMAFGVWFNRTRFGPAEEGVFMGRNDADDEGFIVDFDGKIVKDIWNYYDRFYAGTAIFLEAEKGVKA